MTGVCIYSKVMVVTVNFINLLKYLSKYAWTGHAVVIRIILTLWTYLNTQLKTEYRTFLKLTKIFK